ncbi:hypothetical protein SAMN05444000_104246 [Shimia gijangensis]|uniref:Uncharacterized protein n=1 Tax=Shimia gijangensis TaxID=1470563 RepID=A0A1M6G3Q4_9RHOB|nr:hypothetical protein SAMN05444000_104246 [Shimia gijangensis]
MSITIMGGWSQVRDGQVHVGRDDLFLSERFKHIAAHFCAPFLFAPAFRAVRTS